MSVLAGVSLSCVKEQAEAPKALPEPKAVVSDITCTSFKVSWDAVTDAGSYTYAFNGGEETVTDKNSLVFENLSPKQSYTFSVRADAGSNGNWTASQFVNLRVFTEDYSTLNAPEPVLVCAYKSKTIIRWNAINGASSYEYSVGPYSAKTSSTSVEIGGLEASTEYVFKIKALSDDKYTNESPETEFKFTTLSDSEDIPQIILSEVETGSDYSKFNVYAVADFLYIYFGIPASYFERYSDTEIRDAYLAAYIKSITDAGISVSTGISQYACNGTASYVQSPLYPETSYYIVAFGVNISGQATTPLYKFRTKTLAEDTAPMPDITGASWFNQRLYHYKYGMYNASNSLWFNWKGTDVVKVSEILTSTRSFKNYFDSDAELFRQYVKLQGSEFSDASTIDAINSADGFGSRFTRLSASTSYTLGTMAVNSANDTTFVVSSLPTKSSENYYDWAGVRLGADASDASVLNAVFSFDNTAEVGTMSLKLSGLRYCFCKVSELSGVSVDKAAEIVAERGTDLPQANLDILNMTGALTLSFGKDGAALEADTSYIILVTFSEAGGDAITRYASGKTGASAGTKAAFGRPSARVEFNSPEIVEVFSPSAAKVF